MGVFDSLEGLYAPAGSLWCSLSLLGLVRAYLVEVGIAHSLLSNWCPELSM
jgi:hypothetical protein